MVFTKNWEVSCTESAEVCRCLPKLSDAATLGEEKCWNHIGCLLNCVKPRFGQILIYSMFLMTLFLRNISPPKLLLSQLLILFSFIISFRRTFPHPFFSTLKRVDNGMFSTGSMTPTSCTLNRWRIFLLPLLRSNMKKKIDSPQIWLKNPPTCIAVILLSDSFHLQVKVNKFVDLGESWWGQTKLLLLLEPVVIPAP